MTRPYRPRHRRLRGAHGRPGRSGRPAQLPAPSDIVLAVLSLALLLAAGLVLGGLMAHPFAG